MVRAAIAVLCCGLALLPGDAGAGSTEFGIGYADEIDEERAGVATLGYVTEQRFPWEFLVGHIAERDSDRIKSSNATFVAASRRLRFGRWFVSAGVALTDADNEILSSSGQFLTGAGYAGERWSVSLRHLSNADTGGRNRGETFLTLAILF